MPGVADLCRTAVSMAADVDDSLRARVTEAAEEAIAAVEAFNGWLRDDLLPTADGDFRLGRELYERKFHHALKATITPEELERRASTAYDEVRAEMLRLARELWPDLGRRRADARRPRCAHSACAGRHRHRSSEGR